MIGILSTIDFKFLKDAFSSNPVISLALLKVLIPYALKPRRIMTGHICSWTHALCGIHNSRISISIHPPGLRILYCVGPHYTCFYIVKLHTGGLTDKVRQGTQAKGLQPRSSLACESDQIVRSHTSQACEKAPHMTNSHLFPKSESVPRACAWRLLSEEELDWYPGANI